MSNEPPARAWKGISLGLCIVLGPAASTGAVGSRSRVTGAALPRRGRVTLPRNRVTGVALPRCGRVTLLRDRRGITPCGRHLRDLHSRCRVTGESR